MLPEQDIARQLTNMQKRLERLERLSSSAWKMIEDVNLSAPAASFDFQNIPTLYRHLGMIGHIRSSIASDFDSVGVRFNNDSGNNYDYVQMAVRQAAVLATSEGIAVTSLVLSATAGPALVNVFDSIHFIVHNYASTSNQKTIVSSGMLKQANATTKLWLRRAEGWWRNTAAINRVTIFPGTGPNWIAGSRMTLYGIA